MMFQESQRLANNIYVRISAIILWVIMIGVFVTILSQGESLWTSLMLFIVPLIVTVLLFSFVLETEIDKLSIRYQLRPFGKNEIYWSDIESYEVRKYSPMSEYGGWGYRWHYKNGKAYNISGNIGLQIVTNKGKRILIGTQRAEELNNFLLSIRNENMSN